MSEFFDPYNADRPLMLKCSCGRDHTIADHHAEVAADGAAVELRRRSETAEFEAYSNEFIEATLVKALFPHDEVRRRFLRAVGKGTAMAAIASVLPVASLQAMAQEKQGALEKTNLKIGFIPITCATPLIMAAPLGFYQKQGLNVEVTKTAGWALVRDKMINKEYDATHFLSPMPLAISLGLGSNAVPMNVATIQNINGQAITLALKHKNNRDPKNWKGFKFGIPFDYSMHNFLLRYYLAENGLNPDTDVQLRVMPPAEMVANLRAGNIDGFLGPDPFNQRAVFDEVGFHPRADQRPLERPPLLRLRHQHRVHPEEPQHLCSAVPRGAHLGRHGARPEEPRTDRQGDRAQPVPQPARGRAHAGAHRPLCRRPGQASRTCPSAPTSTRCRGRAWPCGCSRRCSAGATSRAMWTTRLWPRRCSSSPTRAST